MKKKDKKINTILDKIQGLPALPSTVKEVMDVISDPESTVNEIVKAIDPSLATKILQVVNSPYYRRYTNVKSLEHAVSLLGFKTVKELVTGISLLKIFPHQQKTDFDYEGFWRHSLLIAGIAKILAKIIKYYETDRLYTAALIHNIGKVLIGLYMSEYLGEIKRLTREEGLRSREAEKKVLGLDHAEIGGMAGEKWELPEDFVKIIRYHNKPHKLHEELDLLKLCLLINYAANIVNKLNIPDSAEMIEKIEKTGKMLIGLIKETFKPEKVNVDDWETMIQSELELLIETVEGMLSLLVIPAKEPSLQ